MKFRLVNKLYRRNKTTSKEFDDSVMSENCNIIVIFLICVAYLEQLESRIPDAKTIKLTFSLIVTFYVKKTENRTKKSLTQLSLYCFE